MRYTMTTPCDQCPFLDNAQMRRGFKLASLRAFAMGEFPCHKSAEIVEDEDGFSEYRATKDSVHCAGALIFNEKRGFANQMMRICERLRIYDAGKLDMKAKVR